MISNGRPSVRAVPRRLRPAVIRADPWQGRSPPVGSSEDRTVPERKAKDRGHDEVADVGTSGRGHRHRPGPACRQERPAPLPAHAADVRRRSRSVGAVTAPTSQRWTRAALGHAAARGSHPEARALGPVASCTQFVGAAWRLTSWYTRSAVPLLRWKANQAQAPASALAAAVWPGCGVAIVAGP